MDHSPPLSAAFTAARPRLLGLAYRMLGSRSEAEDIVQDTWLRWQGAETQALRSPDAWLTTVATRLCLDKLKSARAQRELYVGPWLPEPVPDAEQMSPEAATALADDLSFALLLVLERLSPAERAAFLLHDVFDTPFPEIARTLQRSEAACRQLASRARKAVRQDVPRQSATDEQHLALLQQFVGAVGNGDVQGLSALLSKDAVAFADGGGVRLSALRPIIGPDRIARFHIGVARKAMDRNASLDFQPAMLNGRPALLVHLNGELDQILRVYGMM
ncbi:MAG: RNA polymerase sigma factor SigJ, partial [Minwuia sp.]|nr:RNA polymerase sigma factor SigJ [Minwuia sp.]